MRYQNYNYEGWDYTNPGWFEFVIKRDDTTYTLFNDKYYEMIEWLYQHVDNCERHARWILQEDTINVKFRYQRDYSWCVLRWG